MGALEINGIQQDSDMVFWIYDNPTMMINNLFVFIVGIIVAVVPQALTIWGAEGIGCLKEVLARV